MEKTEQGAARGCPKCGLPAPITRGTEFACRFGANNCAAPGQYGEPPIFVKITKTNPIPSSPKESELEARKLLSGLTCNGAYSANCRLGDQCDCETTVAELAALLSAYRASQAAVEAAEHCAKDEMLRADVAERALAEERARAERLEKALREIARESSMEGHSQNIARAALPQASEAKPKCTCSGAEIHHCRIDCASEAKGEADG